MKAWAWVFLLGGMLLADCSHAEDVRVHITVSGTTNSVATLNKKILDMKGVQFVSTNADYEVSVVIMSDDGGFFGSMAVAKTAPPVQIIGHWVSSGETKDIESGCDRFVLLFKKRVLEHQTEAQL